MAGFLFFMVFEFFGLSVAGDVGQKLSKVSKNFEFRMENAEKEWVAGVIHRETAFCE
jgi:hypothetical protein